MPRENLNIDAAYIVNEYRSGRSVNDIAGELGVSRRTIDARLINRGIRLRTQSEAEAVKWSRMTEDQRAAQVAAANEAVRGRKASEEEIVKRMKTLAQTRNNVSHHEIKLRDMLERRGVEFIPQHPIGPYLCDIACHPVAVEVWGGHWHWTGDHIKRTPKRFRYIMDAGWHIIVIPAAGKWQITDAVADDLARRIDVLRRDPSLRRQYRVIWGAGEFATGGSVDDDHITVEPPFTYRRNPTNGQYETVPR